jgi:hypothetical protein
VRTRAAGVGVRAEGKKAGRKRPRAALRQQGCPREPHRPSPGRAAPKQVSHVIREGLGCGGSRGKPRGATGGAPSGHPFRVLVADLPPGAERLRATQGSVPSAPRLRPGVAVAGSAPGAPRPCAWTSEGRLPATQGCSRPRATGSAPPQAPCLARPGSGQASQ